MNFELFAARRIFKNKNKNIAANIVQLAVAGISLGLSVMILAITIVSGFKHQVRTKVVGFGSHIIIENYDTNSSFETVPIDRNQDFYQKIPLQEGIRHIQVFATKAGILKTDSAIQGVVLKGVDTDFDWTFLKKN